VSAAVTDRSINFDNPPIHEVALGQTFLHRPDFLIPYYGEFWSLIRDHFPLAEQAPPILEQVDGPTEMPLPRVWFLSNDKTWLVQLQQDRFHLNWRRVGEGNDTGVYVRFPVIQERHLALWSELSRFVENKTGQPLQRVNSELTYTNLIVLPGVATAFEIAEATLANMPWPRVSILPPPKGFSIIFGFDLHDGADLLQVTAVAVRRPDSDTEFVRLDLTVKSKGASSLPFDAWSSNAHDALVRTFKELTNPSMHEIWQLKEH